MCYEYLRKCYLLKNSQLLLAALGLQKQVSEVTMNPITKAQRKTLKKLKHFRIAFMIIIHMIVLSLLMSWFWHSLSWAQSALNSNFHLGNQNLFPFSAQKLLGFVPSLRWQWNFSPPLLQDCTLPILHLGLCLFHFGGNNSHLGEGGSMSLDFFNSIFSSVRQLYMSISEVWNVRISLGENWWEENRSLNNLLYGHQYDVQNLCYLLQTLHLKHVGLQA